MVSISDPQGPGAPDGAGAQPFPELLRRARAGDEAAAAELVRQFEPEIRRKVRTWVRLHAPGLKPLLESMDVCQSVLADFFLRAAVNQYDLDEPRKVLALLVVMTQNKLRGAARDQLRHRRDARRTGPLGAEAEGAAALAATASRIASGRELLDLFRAGLSDEERALADLRARELSWDEVAREIGGTPEGRRKQWRRAVDRVARTLGLVESEDAGLS
jgi:RNA polymerase sigma-70 factor (ECF subfamily)